MNRYFATISYSGKNYVGWQIQPNGMSVQETLESAFSTIMRNRVEVVGAGRTDAGVNANKMFAHFDLSDPIDDGFELCRRLNNFLPKDISIHDIKKVDINAHARFSALSRTYKYYITTKKDVFFHEYKYRIFFNPDIDKMNELCYVFKEYNDFTSFSKLHTDVKTNICHVSDINWVRENDDYIFTIKSNRFLRNMVRSIVGTMLNIGKGKLDKQGLIEIFNQKDRQKAGDSAPGHALFLHDVEYPLDIWM